MQPPPSSYESLVRRLLIPTPDQCADFATHVSADHSWYKHLPPFPPGSTFVFFLDPHAGQAVLTSHDRGAARMEIVDATELNRYGKVTTEEYRRRFGFWNYREMKSPDALGPDDAPRVYGTSCAEWTPVPREVMDACSCRLTACLKEGAVMGRGILDPTTVPPFREYCRQHPEDPDIARYQALAVFLDDWDSGGPGRSVPGMDPGFEPMDFMKVEGALLRTRVVDTLLRSREVFERLRS